MRFTQRPWSEIVAHYASLVRTWPIEPMLDLVEFLAASPYAAGLFPVTSMDRLRLGRVADFSNSGPELQVQFDPHKRHFIFTYLQNPADVRPWTRECGANEGRSTLEHILQRRLRWFERGPLPDDPCHQSGAKRP